MKSRSYLKKHNKVVKGYDGFVEQIANREVILGARGEAGGETMVLLQGIPENAQIVRGHVGILRAGTAVKFTAPGATGSGAR